MHRFRKHALHKPEMGSATWSYIIVALSLGFLVPQLNRWVFPGLVSPIDKTTLTSILSAIASGMITLSGLVFSLLFVLVQFGSATYSPRITRVFAHSHVLHHSLGVFTGTFLYSLMAMRTVGMEQVEPVSGFTIWLAFAWLLGSVIVLSRLVGVFGTLTVTNVLAALGRIGRIAVARVYGDRRFDGAEKKSGDLAVEWAAAQAQSIIYKGEPGYVTGYETEKLVALATGNDVVIELPYGIGDALKDGAPVAVIYGAKSKKLPDRTKGMMILGRERAFKNDPKYAIRLLVDTAIRALSPAINDPTTAVQALDHIESILRRLGNLDLDIGELRDKSGKVRVVYKTPTWEDYLQLSLSEIMQYGATSIQIERRLEALLRFLEQAVAPERAKAVARFATHRHALAQNSFGDATFREWADIADREGIGSHDDRLAVTANGMEGTK